MKLFLNTSDAQAHIRYAEMGVIDGIVLSSHAFGSHAQQLAGLRGLVAAVPDREVLVHSAANDPQQLAREIAELTSVSEAVVVQVPYAIALFPTIAQLLEEGTPVAVAPITSVGQAIIMAKLGVVSISIDIAAAAQQGKKGEELLAEVRDIFDTYASETEIMAVGLTTPEQIELAATIGVDAVTISPALLDKLMA